MKKYIMNRIVEAFPMTLGEFKKRGNNPYSIEKNERHDDDEGYLVNLSDRYHCWWPKAAFEDAYREVKDESENMSFGDAIEVLRQGGTIRRKGWNGKGMFVVKQNPCTIREDILPKLQNLPQSAKDIIMGRENPRIDYTNQMLIINPDGRADSWVPSSSDVFAEDWEIVK